MNKKEILEIKKQFSPENSTITRICSCYIDGEKNIKFKSKEAFHALAEEEAFKYHDIFKHTLSGTIGKNLLNMEFPLSCEEEDGNQNFLLKLRDSQLNDDALIDAFYEKIINSYEYASNYYIILIHANYDIPGKSSDGTHMFDASDEVYEYLLCSICPVNLSKAGLSYNTEKNLMAERMRDWIVAAPLTGFLFPAFHDRGSDVHSVLYYSKNPEELQPSFIDQVLSSTLPLSASGQMETFQAILSDTLGEHCNFDAIKSIHDTLNELMEEHKDEPDPLIVSKYEMRHILEECEVGQDALDLLDEKYDSCVTNETPLLASNITHGKQFSIQTPDIIIKVNPERTDLVETKIIDGRQFLLIAVDSHLEVNGFTVNSPCEKGTAQ
ncbi:MAG: DUF4317 domain-containing protein [Lachnospiraceae bacterium]